MATRSWTTEALVLSLSDCSTDHKKVVLLVPQSDMCTLISATIYGGARSKLRGLVSMYQTGQVWLYSNPVKDTHKIVDFAVHSYRLALREDLVRTWCAAICNEIAIKMHGTVDWQLVNVFLDGLCASTAEECKRALLRFLWRMLSYAGLAPHTGYCGQCGVPLLAAPTVQPMCYNPFDDSFYCASCMQQHSSMFPLHQEACHYLQALIHAAPSYSRALPLSTAAYAELKHCLFFLCEKMVGGKLKSIQTSKGLL